VFWKYQVVFSGTHQPRLQGLVKRGDLFAIARGYTIIAIGKVIGVPENVNRLGLEPSDQQRFAGAVGVKVRLVTLEPKDCLQYKKRGAFCEAKQICDKIVGLYEDYTARFDIKATTCRLGFLNTDAVDRPRLLEGTTTHFVVPIYQRPYSWGPDQINRLLNDIIEGFANADAPLFIGPMQLSFPVLRNPTDGACVREVIDGQQRLTTILLLLKVLQTHYPDSRLRNVRLDWLATRVNNGQQQESLTRALDAYSRDSLPARIDESNLYLKTLYIIRDIWYRSDVSVDGSDINGFVEYLDSKLLVVCVETLASISKTLQIFNTINTAGLDLGGSDLFKIKFYEYLTTKQDGGEEQFENISRLYGKIEEQNKDAIRNRGACRNITSIDEILEIYKYVVILRSGLPWRLYKYGKDTFFERLFDTISGVTDWKDQGFAKANIAVLSVADLEKLIDARYRFEEVYKGFSPEGQCSYCTGSA
jgi:hypothetical protein